jgi:hypothetical protein
MKLVRVQQQVHSFTRVKYFGRPYVIQRQPSLLHIITRAAIQPQVMPTAQSRGSWSKLGE